MIWSFLYSLYPPALPRQKWRDFFFAKVKKGLTFGTMCRIFIIRKGGNTAQKKKQRGDEMETIYGIGKQIRPVKTNDWEPISDHSPSDIVMCSTDYYFSPSTKTIKSQVYMHSNNKQRIDYYEAIVVTTRRNPCHVVEE